MDFALLRRTWGAYLPASTPLVAKIFVGIGLLLLPLSLAFALHTWWLARPFARIDATVTENVAAQDAKGQIVYTTHLNFQLADGRIINFVDPIQSSEGGDPDFSTGQIVPVIYLPGKPEDAQIATTWRLYYMANVLGLLGIVFVDLGLILKRVLRRAAQNLG